MAKDQFLRPGERLLMEGPANMQQVAVLGFNKGGKLYLTDQRLVFLAHALNFGSKFDEIPLSDIAVTGGTFNLLVPTPNMIKVITKDKREYKFVVSGRQKEGWKQAIFQAAQAFMAGTGQS